MTVSAILSAEEVASERYRYPDSTTEDGANDVIALADSHEALRSRLADTEAKADADYMERCIAEGRAVKAEAALAEAVELLRGTAYPAFGPDLAAAVDRARAFIEAHG